MKKVTFENLEVTLADNKLVVVQGLFTIHEQANNDDDITVVGGILKDINGVRQMYNEDVIIKGNIVIGKAKRQ